LSDAADRTTAPGLRPHDDHPDPSVAARGAVDTAAIRVVMQSTDKPRVAVIGAGSWGTTFAKVLAEGGAETVLWARRPEIAREITETKRNSEYLPGINLPRTLTANTSLARVLEGAEQVYVSVPSQTLRSNLDAIRELLPAGVPVVSLMKGVEKGTGLRMSEVLLQGLGIDQDRIAVASGPNLALEIARRQPTAAVISSSSADTATAVAAVATNPYFRSFINTDVIGTEFGGVLKNLIAVAIGIVDGVGYGENTKASIITRGLAEMTDFALRARGPRRPHRHVPVPALAQQHRRPPARPGVPLRRGRPPDEPDRRGARVRRADPRTRRGERCRHAHRGPGRRGPRR
jgi:glycerol-3-phosphate dehydrogenase (NAD(P)+)